MLERPEDCDEDKNAQSLVELIKGAWFPTEQHPNWLQTAVVKRLIIGLKHGAVKNCDTPPVMWRSFIVHACYDLNDNPTEDTVMMAMRIRRVHRTIRQAGIGHGDYGNYRELLGDDRAASRIYNAAIETLREAMRMAEADAQCLRGRFPIPTSGDRSIDDVISSLVDRSVSRDQRISDARDLSALIHAQHDMLFINKRRMIETAIKAMEDMRDQLKSDQMEGIEETDSEMHDAQTGGTGSNDEDLEMTDAQMELVTERQILSQQVMVIVAILSGD
ncbi:hypothetical protein H9Q69_013012 [Fusarium xylarioides]|uniref:Uncharacterized protein n=1 Tax=Fusarium xylarioides TaxID=221167 RepID=A0A9P7I8Q4_9HYPO|nr:hypothetical protein H9Q70_012994 [Fusarium xylarioides]KAG5758853.1 hypothetical protein H9Q72_013016 [Fusarium xylarioides]KAG5771644.1 hypothetical protein H9Q73_012790 [Fusarium xylarioides]KAG5787917.1 hypothetical protein H9Q69_013012 [Fusarium xylarioides]KAG5803487.1 hypothetical protein H9Q71_011928 [Fusarium xylarioides]